VRHLYLLNVKVFFYGQCSEICGVNHGFMPIVVEGTKPAYFSEWYSNEKIGSEASDLV